MKPMSPFVDISGPGLLSVETDCYRFGGYGRIERQYLACGSPWHVWRQTELPGNVMRRTGIEADVTRIVNSSMAWSAETAVRLRSLRELRRDSLRL